MVSRMIGSEVVCSCMYRCTPGVAGRATAPILAPWIAAGENGRAGRLVAELQALVIGAAPHAPRPIWGL